MRRDGSFDVRLFRRKVEEVKLYTASYSYTRMREIPDLLPSTSVPDIDFSTLASIFLANSSTLVQQEESEVLRIDVRVRHRMQDGFKNGVVDLHLSIIVSIILKDVIVVDIFLTILNEETERRCVFITINS